MLMVHPDKTRNKVNSDVSMTELSRKKTYGRVVRVKLSSDAIDNDDSVELAFPFMSSGQCFMQYSVENRRNLYANCAA